MDWTDEGIIIGTRRHGESSLIVELMTAGHGRHLGLVRGGRSRSQRPVLQTGNSVHATWRARLDEHLGNYAIEPATFRAAKLMETPAGLYGLQALAALVGGGVFVGAFYWLASPFTVTGTELKAPDLSAVPQSMITPVAGS